MKWEENNVQEYVITYTRLEASEDGEHSCHFFADIVTVPKTAPETKGKAADVPVEWSILENSKCV